MGGEYLGTLGVELDLLDVAYVDLGEVALVETGAQDMSFVVDVLRL